ncbi:phage portal protein [[Clostridium] leptum]|nr:phage portal protein [[Clostridium] leptum]
MDWETIRTELGGIYGQTVLREMGEIIRLYDFYDGRGQDWPVNGQLDYIPTRKKTNLVKKLIKSEARFLFGKTPEISLYSPGQEQCDMELWQKYLGDTLIRNRWGDKLIKAARDCFIGKRVALRLWVEEDHIAMGFRPSLEFVYEPEEDDAEKIKKIIFFYHLNQDCVPSKQRIWRQKYTMVNGRCILNEGIYDGSGHLMEEKYHNYDTGLSFIPAYVIVNDGLTGDLMGESDVAELRDNQEVYNRLCSDDIDALKFHMFPQRVAVDASPQSLQNMVIAPGALVDLQTDPSIQSGQASMQTLESQFGYDARLEHTLSRIKEDMYNVLSVPDVGTQQIQGSVYSGKAIKALYWDLICRCEEKWTVWEPALVWMSKNILKMAAQMGWIPSLQTDYQVHVEHCYPIPDDEEEERLNDLKEVESGVRSVSSYQEKWGILPGRDGEKTIEPEPADKLKEEG